VSTKLDWLKIRGTNEYVRYVQPVTDGGFRLMVEHEDGSLSLVCVGDVLRVEPPHNVADYDIDPGLAPRWYNGTIEVIRAGRAPRTPRRPAPPATPVDVFSDLARSVQRPQAATPASWIDEESDLYP
jgi:hypothetical protein